MSRFTTGRGRRGAGFGPGRAPAAPDLGPAAGLRLGRAGLGLPVRPGPGACLRMRKRCVPASSPPARTSVRVVTKCPVPSLVVLRSDTDSMTVSKPISSPGRSGRRYSCSQSVATTEVYPAPSRSANSSSYADDRSVCPERPPIVHAWSMVGGATASGPR
ncbi:hypothetical protein STANM309S_05477 [Streptomyces tanashiensis]